MKMNSGDLNCSAAKPFANLVHDAGIGAGMDRMETPTADCVDHEGSPGVDEKGLMNEELFPEPATPVITVSTPFGKFHAHVLRCWHLASGPAICHGVRNLPLMESTVSDIARSSVRVQQV